MLLNTYSIYFIEIQVDNTSASKRVLYYPSFNEMDIQRIKKYLKSLFVSNSSNYSLQSYFEFL